MSTRALRKLQKEKEAIDQYAAAESSEEETYEPPKPKFNAFDLLNAGGDEDTDEDAQPEEAALDSKETIEESATQPTSANKSKKKKKKKNKKKAAGTTTQAPADDGIDEIDRALKELSTSGNQDPVPAPTIETTAAQAASHLCTLLAIENKNLNSLLEMKRLFGNIAVEGERLDARAIARRQRPPRTLDLGSALLGIHCPATKGKDMTGVPMRRNALFQAKDEWPRATSGGLGMEVVSRSIDGIEFKLVHNPQYQEVQAQFELAVQMMNPDNMISLLRYNPYHISLLLQVSEIAKHQEDHSVSGDLLERALFSIGRSVNSSFAPALRQGRVRMSFEDKANREMWLVCWRYLSNLIMKGTYRTAFEWAKLILGLDPKEDPYSIKLIIDQLALKSRQFEALVDLATESSLADSYKRLPNIQTSLGLAYHRLGRVKESRAQLALAMSQFPSLFTRLAQELGIEPVPPYIWGEMPPSTSIELYSELYIRRSKDIWNTPETIAILKEVANDNTLPKDIIPEVDITLNDARHVFLSDIPAMLSLLPKEFLNRHTSSSDPLPPGDDLESQPTSSSGSASMLQRLLAGWRPELPEDFESEDEDADRQADPNRNNLLMEDTADNTEASWDFLNGRGLQDLEAFFTLNGVDNGNWETDIEMEALFEYADRLIEFPDAQRRREVLAMVSQRISPNASLVLEEVMTANVAADYMDEEI